MIYLQNLSPVELFLRITILFVHERTTFLLAEYALEMFAVIPYSFNSVMSARNAVKALVCLSAIYSMVSIH